MGKGLYILVWLYTSTISGVQKPEAQAKLFEVYADCAKQMQAIENDPSKELVIGCQQFGPPK